MGGRAATHAGVRASVFGMSGRHGSEVHTFDQAQFTCPTKPSKNCGALRSHVLHTIPAAPALAAITGNGKVPGTSDQVTFGEFAVITAEPAFVTNRLNRTLFVNRAAADLLRFDGAEAAGLPYWRLLGGRDRDRLARQ